MWKLAMVAACGIACGGSSAAAQSVSADAVGAKPPKASMQSILRGLSEGASAVAPGLESVRAFAATEELSVVQRGLPACACVRGLVESASPDAAVTGTTRSLLQGATNESKSAGSLVSSLIAGAASAASDRGPGVSTVSAFAGQAASAELAASNPDVNTP
jgi:hypothetical protein